MLIGQVKMHLGFVCSQCDINIQSRIRNNKYGEVILKSLSKYCAFCTVNKNILSFNVNVHGWWVEDNGKLNVTTDEFNWDVI